MKSASMTKNILDRIFQHHPHVTDEELNAYLRGEATEEVRQKLEHLMLDDPLLSDAMDGFQDHGLHSVPEMESFAEFKKKLPVEKATENNPVLVVRHSYRWAMAAAAGVVLVLAAYFLSKHHPRKHYIQPIIPITKMTFPCLVTERSMNYLLN